ncbi:hypothetical protein ACFVU2_06310 [Leifsonia sp. NPDC058194]|uniref:hypothetical protein n=1 Tax=Leifsonia sp. NPDC058194 TaxID=3346374 RepID=UPI0036DBBE95
MSEQSPFQPTFQTPPAQHGVTYAAPPSVSASRRSPVLGYVSLGVAAFDVLAGLVMETALRQFVLTMHYADAGYVAFSSISMTVGILLDLVVIAIAVVALVGRRGTVPAAIALGVGGAGLVSALGSLLINSLPPFGG